MKFTQTVKIYQVNENNTVTVYAPNPNVENKNDYFQCKARFKLLAELDELDKGTTILGQFGLYYDKGKGLTIQLIGYEVVEVPDNEK